MWRWAAEATYDIWREAKELPDEAAASRIYTQKWTKRAERCRHIEDAFMHLRALADIAIKPDVFDQDPWLLNVENGTIDLRTGELKPHRREDMITRLSPAVYDPDAGPPARWLQFLSEIFDANKNLIDFVQRVSGYTLTGSVSEQKFFLLCGGGVNGKTTFLNTLMYVMGEYAVKLAPGLLFTARRDMRPSAFAGLKGRRLAAIAQVEFGSKLAEVVVKELTGCDRIVARRKWGDSFEFEPTHKLFICGNHLPAIRETDHAIWRRILLIPFTGTIPEERQDRELPAKLRAEASGILNWLVRGCLEWQKNGLAPPAEVADAAGSYRSDMDVLGDFLDECIIPNPDSEVTNPEMRKAYEEWCQHSGERPMSARGLTLRMKERGFVQKRIGHSRTRTWVGIALEPYEEPLSEDQLRQLEEMAEKVERLYQERKNRGKI
jgi:putative DNA primase/helicase